MDDAGTTDVVVELVGTLVVGPTVVDVWGTVVVVDVGGTVVVVVVGVVVVVVVVVVVGAV